MPARDLNPSHPVGARPPLAVPDYDAHQRAFQVAFRPELLRILTTLPIPPGARVLDAPCGRGFYARHLAQSGHRVTAIDQNPAYLVEARLGLAGLGTVIGGDVYDLPLEDGSQDFVVCVQSLVSLGDPERLFCEFRRVLAPGGTLAVIESDQFHHLLLPWPVEVEAAVFEATVRANQQLFHDAGRTAPLRRVRAQLAAAGFASVTRTTHAADYAAPLAAEVAEFLLVHGLMLRELLSSALPNEAHPAFDRLTRPDSPEALFRQGQLEFTVLNVAVTARRE